MTGRENLTKWRPIIADTKISALSALLGANVDAAADVLPIVDTSVTTTKKILVSELLGGQPTTTVFGGATTLLTIGGTGASSVFAIPGTLEWSGTTGAFTVAGGAYIAKKLKVVGAVDFGSTLGVTGAITPSADVANVVWTDYSATTTLVGWSSTTVKQVWYKKVGKLVFCKFSISGTSNAVGASFTVPYAVYNDYTVGVPSGTIGDNGTLQTAPGLIIMTANSATISLTKDLTTANFTASGTKRMEGQFWYEATT